MYVYIVAFCSASVEFHFCNDYAMAINSSMMADPFFVDVVVGIFLMDGLRVVDMQTSKYYTHFNNYVIKCFQKYREIRKEYLEL